MRQLWCPPHEHETSEMVCCCIILCVSWLLVSMVMVVPLSLPAHGHVILFSCLFFYPFSHFIQLQTLDHHRRLSLLPAITSPATIEIPCAHDDKAPQNEHKPVVRHERTAALCSLLHPSTQVRVATSSPSCSKWPRPTP